jgi:hypothetical protein
MPASDARAEETAEAPQPRSFEQRLFAMFGRVSTISGEKVERLDIDQRNLRDQMDEIPRCGHTKDVVDPVHGLIVG